MNNARLSQERILILNEYPHVQCKDLKKSDPYGSVTKDKKNEMGTKSRMLLCRGTESALISDGGVDGCRSVTLCLP